MLVTEVMTRGLQRISASDSIRTAARLMREHDIGMLLVEDAQGKISGVITDRDIACRATAEGRDSSTPVEACMSHELLSCHAEDDLYDAVELMKRERVRRLLVRNWDGQPVGVLAQADVAQAIATYGLAGEMLQDISQPGGKHSQR